MTLGSITARNAALDACYGGLHASNWPATLWVHLYGGNPTTGGPELSSAGGYAPTSFPNDDSGWSPATGGQKINASTPTFPVSTGAWSAAASYFWLTDSESSLPAPSTPTVTPEGATGASSWQYVVTALNAVGETTPSGIGVTTSGVTALSTTDYNAIAWAAVTDASSYNVYRLTAGVFELIGNTTGTTFDDTGQNPTAQNPPASNGTMTLLDGGPLASPIFVPASGYTISFPPGTIVIAD